ncbi:hypothetical protein GCM10011346_37560 [Oceanobacillus neutriphilus]|uniref:Uncharacterized protein n=1 Tax=Oceanobacillus neutriphilus TaxID=531815 RepID=A0ABQ2NZ94_9BACI|nr:hypothetical protein GCM10011346_37560 [Oceanobacillus neutriphilus]
MDKLIKILYGVYAYVNNALPAVPTIAKNGITKIIPKNLDRNDAPDNSIVPLSIFDIVTFSPTIRLIK